MLQVLFQKQSFPRFFSLLALVLLAGCVQTQADLAAARIAADPAECRAPASSACFFRNSPVQLLPEKVRIAGRPLDFFPIATELEFVDGRNKKWVAPIRTLTDGASIPQIFVPIVGDPRDPSFVNAAAVHDAYCGVGNEAGPVYHAATWQEVHRMFYDTLVVGGTAEPKAQLMFAAVWLGGPRWYPNNRRNETSMERLPASLRRTALVETRTFISANEPSFQQLILYLKWKEWQMKRSALGESDAPPFSPVETIEITDRGDATLPITGEGDPVVAVGGL